MSIRLYGLKILCKAEKVAKLFEKGLMTPAGYESIEIAKKSGTWSALDGVDIKCKAIGNKKEKN